MLFVKLVVLVLALVGALALVIVLALAQPLIPPPPLASIHAGALTIPRDGLPDLSRFQARDGTWLAYRLYPAADGATDRLAVLAHGSSASSEEMHAVASALAAAGVSAAAIDARGHGASGSRGDIGYIGQLDDDLADLVAHLRPRYPNAKWALIGHSAGGGFAARIASGPLGATFERFILLAPYLGYRAPTNRANEGAGRWVSVDLPRIVALAALGRLGVEWGQGLPAIAFANRPEDAPYVTPSYSFRLMANYAVPEDWRAPFAARGAQIIVIAGQDDELMDTPAYAPTLAPFGVEVITLPGVDHLGVVHAPAALAKIVEAAKR